MATQKTADKAAEDCLEFMRANGADVVTFGWPDFYEFVGRQRLGDRFHDEFTAACTKRMLIFACSHSVAMVAKDFNFAPMDAKSLM